MKNEIGKLAKLGRIRNRLLAASVLKSELRLAAERVMRLSEAGSAQRFFTLCEVAEESGLSTTAIVDEITRIKSEPAPAPQKEKP